VKIQGKSSEILAKSVITFTKSLKIWAHFLKTWAKNGAQLVLILKNGTQRVQNHMKIFFGGHPEKGLHEKMFAQKVAQNFFGQVWGSLRKNFSNPQELVCSYPYGNTCQKDNNRWFLTTRSENYQ